MPSFNTYSNVGIQSSLSTTALRKRYLKLAEPDFLHKRLTWRGNTVWRNVEEKAVQEFGSENKNQMLSYLFRPGFRTATLILAFCV